MLLQRFTPGSMSSLAKVSQQWPTCNAKVSQQRPHMQSYGFPTKTPLAPRGS
jgi:hypothetical protein